MSICHINSQLISVPEMPSRASLKRILFLRYNIQPEHGGVEKTNIEEQVDLTFYGTYGTMEHC